MALTDKLTAIANAIRAKTGKTESLTLEQMPTEIESIATGGGSSDDVRYVTFRNEATGEEFVKPVATGDDCVDVVAKGLWEKPTKPSDAQYDYTFYGWGASDGGAADANILKNITEDKTVYAIFTGTLRSYTITWLDEDGSELKSETLLYGAMPSYTPEKEGFAFDGWTPTPTIVTGDASYTSAWVKVIGGSCGDNANWEYNANTGTLTLYGSGAVSSVEWKDQIQNINSIIVEDGITTLPTGAFQGCTALTSVTLPESLTSMGYYPFSSCTSLNSITIPNGVTNLEDNTFLNCSALSSVTLPHGLTQIGYQAFYGCSSLKSITIPSNVTLIEKNAFANSGLTNAYFEKNSGWYGNDSAYSTTKTRRFNVTDSAAAATSLVSTYASYYWHNE